MSTRLFVSVSKKIRPKPYTSHGAACGLRTDFPVAALDDPAKFVAEIRRSMELCELAVEEELIRLEQHSKATPVELKEATINNREHLPPPAPNPTPRARRADPPPAVPPPGPADEFNEVDDDQADDEEDPPTDGRQLLGWARKQTPDLKSWVISWGYKTKTKGNVIDWPEAKVSQCYAAARKALAAGKTKAR